MRSGILVLVLLLAGCAAPQAPPAQAPVVFDALQVETELGAFTAILFCDQTPQTCAFMRGLAEEGYYDGRAFGRVIPGFVIQEVDRTGGTTDQPERVAAEFGTSVTFSAGAFGIARDADPDSGGSEFFVMDHPASHLYGNYTAFAQVVDGMDVVHAIARVPAVRTGPATVVGAPPGSPVGFGVHDRVPVEPVVMTRVMVTTVQMDEAEAARYPLRTSESVRGDAHRSTLEWPADLAAGVASRLTWYVWPRDASPSGVLADPEPLPLEGATIEVAGPESATLAPLDVREDVGKLVFEWAPASPGDHALRLVHEGRELGAASVRVPG